MAVQGNLNQPAPDLEPPLQLVGGIPTGDLIDPVIVGSIDLVGSSPIINRFPTPPLAGGFLVDAIFEVDPDWVVPGPRVTRSIVSILSPSLDVLEPQIGQIWPR